MAVDNIARGMAASALKNQGGGGVSKASELENDVPFVSATAQTLTEEQKQQAQENIGLGGLVVSVGGDTLTWDGNTEGLATFGGIAFKVLEKTPTQDDFAGGGSVTTSAGATITFGSENVTVEEEIGAITVCAPIDDVGDVPFVYVFSQDTEVDGLGPVEAGVYFADFDKIGVGGGYVSSLTIPGYTGFVKKQLKEEYIPDMYYEEIAGSVMFEERTVNFQNQGGVVFGMVEVSVNDTIERCLNDMMGGKVVDFRVVFDGIPYDVKYSGTKPGMFGNLGLLPNEGREDTGEPFVIGVDHGVFVVYAKTVGEHTISLSRLETVVHKIPTKYLPANNFTITMSMGAGPGSWSIDKTVEDITKAISKGDVVYIDATVAGAGVVSLTSISTDGAFIFSTFEIGTSIIFFYDVHISTTGQVTFRTYSLNKTQ